MGAMYREEIDALRARLVAAEADAARERARADAAEAQLDAAARGEPSLATVPRDVHYGLARGLLGTMFALWLALVLVSFPAYIMICHQEPVPGVPPTLMGIVMAVTVDVFTAPAGLGSLFALVGLHRRQRWGYVAAVTVFCGALLFLCLPIGGYGLWALLRRPVREAFYPPAPGR